MPFNVPGCMPTSNVLQQLEGTVLFVNADCVEVEQYLTFVFECIICASENLGGFCKMLDCKGQLKIKSSCKTTLNFSNALVQSHDTEMSNKNNSFFNHLTFRIKRNI